MKVSKNRWRGARIDDLNELVILAKCRESVVISKGNVHFVRPAAFVIQWPLAMILNNKIYHCLDWDPNEVDRNK